MTVATSRAIRVFVSSTFRDMAAEREELVKFVFPQLRKLCEQRGVTWGEVDLRWGIPDEQVAEGKVLPICLAEIERSRPYFIGLLGERYGWVPEEVPQELIDEEPWLQEHLHHSVTELEILHGVLRKPEMAEHAFFYLRDPAYVDRLPEEQRADYREADAALAGKLAALKERIRGSGFPVREGEDYPDPNALGQLVLEDLTALIERLYPAGSEPDALQREAAEHEAFAAGRAGVYIGRREYYERLDAHADGEGPPLVVLGASGGGKSALLAKWALERREAHPEELLLMHFVGASPGSSEWAGMLRRIIGELMKHFAIEVEIPDSPEELRPAFANLLHMAAAKGRVVLIIDALDQLEDREGARELLWLPPQAPANVRLVLSTLPGAPLDEVTKRGWPALPLEPLRPEERKRLITVYLTQYRKELSAARAERLAAAPQSANPLFLRALLEELRVWGQHETLDERITHLLAAAGPEELYALILERYEADYDRERPNLVREAMSLIWAARRGLSESELLDLLGEEGRPLPRALWSPLYLAAEQSLVDRAGYLTFFHEHLREAVRRRYVPTPDAQGAFHLRLADYFGAQERRLSARGVDELPWQLADASSWRRLYDLLAELPFLDAAWQANEFEVKVHWAAVGRHSDLRLVDAYRRVVENPQRFRDDIWTVATLLADSGHPAESLSLRAYLVDHYRELGDLANLQACLGNQALILYDRGDLKGAMALFQEQERMCRELGNPAGLQSSLGNQAAILHCLGSLNEAMAMLRESERICRELGEPAGVQYSLGIQSVILENRGDLEGAMALYQEQERICRELGNLVGLQRVLGGQANILSSRGDLEGAMALLKEQECICRELGDPRNLQRSIGSRAVILYDRGDLEGAMALHKEEERICRELGDPAGLGRSLGNQALILEARGDLKGAMALLRKQERISCELGDLAGLGRSIGNQAVILKAWGYYEDAMALHKEEERICRELGNPAGLQSSLGGQALILRRRGDLDGAMALHKEEERICRELGLQGDLGISLYNQARCQRQADQPAEALPLIEESVQIAQQLASPHLKDRLRLLKLTRAALRLPSSHRRRWWRKT